MTNKLLICCATEKGYQVLQAIHREFPGLIGLVSGFIDKKDISDSGNKIREFCKQNKINYISSGDLKSDWSGHLSRFEIGSMFIIGWRYLVPLELNETLDYDIIIFHDSLLPEYRGFCPTASAIINGETEAGVTAFYAVEEVDAGPIISRDSVEIGRADTIREVMEKQAGLYVKFAIALAEKIKSGEEIASVPQDHSRASYSIWRDEFDMQIDWQQSAESIFNFIRALTYPYTGAYTYYQDKKVIINSVEVLKDLNFEIRYPGKFWRLEDGLPVVVCGDGLIRITDCNLENGDTITFSRLRSRFYSRDYSDEV